MELYLKPPKKILVFIAALLCYFTVHSQQQFTIEGNVKNMHGKNVEGVVVFIEGTFYETDTDSAGNYSLDIQATTNKEVTIIAEKKGYDAIFQDVILEEGSEPITVDLLFVNQTFNLEEVVVTVDRDVTEVKPVATESLGYIDVLANSADMNVIATLNAVSGAQQLGESGELSVRGGEGSETQYLFDGMILRNQLETSPQNQGSRLRFSPLLFKNFEFYAGGFSAEYGQALSSILVMESGDIPLERGISLVASPFFVDVTNNILIGKNQSLEVNANIQDFSIYSDLIEPDLAYQRLEKGPRTFSGSLFYKNRISDKGILKLFSYGYGAKVISLVDNIDDGTVKEKADVGNTNSFNLATLNYRFDAKNELKLGVSYGFNEDSIREDILREDLYETGDPRKRVVKDFHAKTKYTTALTSSILLNTGAEFFNQSSKFSDNLDSKTLNDNLLALYTEGRVKIVKNLFTSLGARYEYSWLTANGNLAPRYNLSYDNTRTKVNFSYGQFYQQTSLDNLLLNTSLNYLKADHFILSFEKKYVNHILKLDIYNKDYKRLLRNVNEVVTTDGGGYAKGIDFSVKGKKIFKKYTYQLGYSFLDSKRLYLDFPIEAPVRFSAKHSASFLVNSTFFKDDLTVSLNYNYNSGRPYYNPNRSEADFNSDLTTDFHDLSANFFYSIKIKNTPLLLMTSISNILGSEQTYGYQYSDVDLSLSRPIRSLYNRFVFVGCYVSLGSDKSKEYIDEIINN